MKLNWCQFDQNVLLMTRQNSGQKGVDATPSHAASGSYTLVLVNLHHWPDHVVRFLRLFQVEEDFTVIICKLDKFLQALRVFLQENCEEALEHECLGPKGEVLDLLQRRVQLQNKVSRCLNVVILNVEEPFLVLELLYRHQSSDIWLGVNFPKDLAT